MGEKYSKEDHDKCKKVAEVFQELYDILGDTCVLDAGEFGFVYLTQVIAKLAMLVRKLESKQKQN